MVGVRRGVGKPALSRPSAPVGITEKVVPRRVLSTLIAVYQALKHSYRRLSSTESISHYFLTGDNLYLNVNAQTVCRFDPCKYTTCLQGTAAKCVVNTRCHPVFLDAFGKIMKCKGMIICSRNNNAESEIGSKAS